MSQAFSVIASLEDFLDRRPFTPFVIVMNSGERYTVTGRHQVAVGKNVLVVIPPNSASIHLRFQGVSSVEELVTEPNN